jgi:hypothetical protein
VTIWSPRSLSGLLERAGLRVIAEGQNSPAVNRFELPRPLALAVAVAERLGGWVGMRSRCWVAARRVSE